MSKKNQRAPASPGRLSVMRLSLVAALAVMASADVLACDPASSGSSTFTGGTSCIIWTGGDVTVSNGVSVSTNSTVGLTSSSVLGNLTNNGTISYTGSSTLSAFQNSGTIASANNAGGVIQGNAGAGLANSGVISILNNSVDSTIGGGTIAGGTFGVQNTGTITAFNNDGTITGAAGSGIGSSVFIGTLTNTGTIGGSVIGIGNTGSIQSLNNNTGGTIGGTTVGVANGGAIDAFNNAGGTITGTTGVKNTATVGTLTNSGLISGGVYAINNSGTISALTNTGTISGGSYAINLDSSGNLGPIANAGLIAGAVFNASSNNVTINGGAGSTFGTLTGAGGGVGVGNIGTITNSQSNLFFASGNQLLNDKIDVTGHTATNSGAVLQINNEINVIGNYTQNAGGTLNIGVADGAQATGVVSADSGYGRLVVSGVATFDAGSSIALKKLNSYAFAQGQRFVVVQADNANANYHAGALNYSADGFTGNISGASVVDTDNANKTDLMITLAAAGGGNAPVNNATDGNASAALGGLFHYTGNNAGLLSVFNPAAALGTSDAANKAGAQLSPAATGTSLAQSVQMSTQAVIDVTTAHIDAVRVAQASGAGTGIATGERPNDVAVWGQAFYGQANQSDRTGASGYRAGYNGTLIGVDTAVGDQWRAGGLFSYANTSMANTGDSTGSSGHATSFGVTGYAGYAGDTWYLDLSAGASAQMFNTLRAVSFAGFAGGASGSFDGTQYIASAQAGYPIKLDAVTTLTPIGGLTYSRLHQDGYTETGSAAALQIGSASTTSIKSDLGAKLERVFKTSYGDLTPSAQLSWRHEYRDTGLRSVASFAADTTGSTSFVSQAVAPEKDTGVLVLGATLARSQNLTLAAHYTLEAAGGYTAQTADVRLRYQF